MTTLSSARHLALTAHANQTDKSGKPYTQHLRRVAQAVSPDEDAEAVAWLHDLVEDQPAHAAAMVELMPVHIVRAVLLLTKVKGESEALYFARIKADPLALKVKLADIADNSSEARLAALDEATQARLRDKYARAVAALTPPHAQEAPQVDEAMALIHAIAADSTWRSNDNTLYPRICRFVRANPLTPEPSK